MKISWLRLFTTQMLWLMVYATLDKLFSTHLRSISRKENVGSLHRSYERFRIPENCQSHVKLGTSDV